MPATPRPPVFTGVDPRRSLTVARARSGGQPVITFRGALPLALTPAEARRLAARITALADQADADNPPTTTEVTP